MILEPLALLVAASLLTLGARIEPPRQAPPAEPYNRAVEHYNAGEVAAARAILEGLVREQPRYFRSYDFYWQVHGKTAAEGALDLLVAEHLEFFDSVPLGERSEDYYSAYLSGCEILEQADRADRIRAEAIERFPRSTTAQSALLDAARAEPDPVRAVALFDAFLRDFADNVSWARMAAEHKFRLVMENRDRFGAEDGPRAAEVLDRLGAQYGETYGRLSRRLIDLRTIAEAFLPVEPARSMHYADLAQAFVLERAAETEEFDETATDAFQALRMEAHAALEEWDEVCKLGSALLPTPETAVRNQAHQEAHLRRLHALGLEHTGELDAARLQLGRAVVLDPQLAESLAAFQVRHPMDESRLALFEEQVARYRERREAARREALLATETRRSAPDFTLSDLAGAEVSLASLRGKVVVLDFWATWCEPCILELDDMKPVAAEYAGNADVAFVAVSVDSEKEKVAPFVEKHGYPYRILLSDGSVEQPYGTRSIPQLYVLDAEGCIRFHQSAYHRDHFRQHLRWMIDAASRP